jgi:O-antigen ligase
MKRLVRYCDHFIYGCLLLFIFTVPLSIAVSEGLFVLGLVGWGVKAALDRKLHWRRTPLDFPILSFVTIAFLSSFWGVDVGNSLIGFRTYALILIIYLLFNNVSESGKGRMLVWSLLTGASVLSVFTVIDRLSMVTSGMDPVLAGSMSEAGQLLIVIGITAAFLLYQKERRAKMLLLLPLLVMVLAEVLNFKRGSWAALILVLIIQGCVKSRKIIPVVVVLSIAISLLYQPARERLLGLKDEFSPLRGGRVAMWETLPAIIRDHPMGVGIDNVGSVMYRYNPEIEKGRDHLHSTCPQIFAEMGPLGLAAFVWWMVVFIRISYGNFRRIGNENSYEKALALGIFSAFIGFMINGIVEFNFGDSEVVMIIYFLMGLTLMLNKGAIEHLGVGKQES